MSITSEVAANLLGSSTAAIISRFVCHPIDTVKSRVQTSTLPALQIIRNTIHTEGYGAFYKGVGPVIIGGVPGVCMYLTSYEYVKSFLLTRDEKISPFIVYITSALFAEASCCLVFVPVDVLKERMQISVDSRHPSRSGPVSEPVYSGTREAFMKVVKTEGIRGLYRGYGATLASYGPFACLYFVLYEQFKDLAASRYGNVSFFSSLSTSAAAGAIASAVTSPLDMIKLRLQVQNQSASLGVAMQRSSQSVTHYKGMMDGLASVFRAEGVRGLFRGMGTRVLFHTPSTALTMALFESCKKMWLPVFG